MTSCTSRFPTSMGDMLVVNEIKSTENASLHCNELEGILAPTNTRIVIQEITNYLKDCPQLYDREGNVQVGLDPSDTTWKDDVDIGLDFPSEYCAEVYLDPRRAEINLIACNYLSKTSFLCLLPTPQYLITYSTPYTQHILNTLLPTPQHLITNTNSANLLITVILPIILLLLFALLMYFVFKCLRKNKKAASLSDKVLQIGQSSDSEGKTTQSISSDIPYDISLV